MAATLTPAAVMEIKRLYSLTDQWGRRLHTQMQIAKIMGVGESTVYRAIRGGGAYADIRELPTESEAQESMKRFIAANPDLVPVQTRMAEDVAAARERIELPAKTLNEMEEKANEIPDAGYD